MRRRIPDRARIGQPWSLVAHQAHAVRDETGKLAIAAAGNLGERGFVDLDPDRTRTDGLPRRRLDRSHLAEEILHARGRLAKHRHSAEIADIPVLLSAGVEREDRAFLPARVGRSAVEARPGRREQVLEVQPADCLLDPDELCDLTGGDSHADSPSNRLERVDDGLGSLSQQPKLLGCLDGAQLLEDRTGLDQPGLRQGRCSAASALAGRKECSTASVPEPRESFCT